MRLDVAVDDTATMRVIQCAAGLQPEVGLWEPADALFGGPDGLSVVRAIVRGAGAVLKPMGLLALEVGERQPEIVAQSSPMSMRTRRTCSIGSGPLVRRSLSVSPSMSSITR